jgi:hypothetical protein
VPACDVSALQKCLEENKGDTKKVCGGVASFWSDRPVHERGRWGARLQAEGSLLLADISMPPCVCTVQCDAHVKTFSESCVLQPRPSAPRAAKAPHGDAVGR